MCRFELRCQAAKIRLNAREGGIATTIVDLDFDQPGRKLEIDFKISTYGQPLTIGDPEPVFFAD